MYAKLTILAFVAVAACSHVQAGLIETNNRAPRYEPDDDQDQYAPPPPPSYESLQQQGSNYLPAQQYPGAQMPVAPQVYQAQQQQSVAQGPIPARQPGQFRAHLRELGKSGVTSGRRALAEARPALSGLRSDLNGLASSVMNNPKVSKLVQAAKPKVEGVKARAQPLVEKSSKRIGDLAARAQQRLANRGQHKQQQHGGLAPVLEDPAAELYEQSNEVYPPMPPAYAYKANEGRFVQ